MAMSSDARRRIPGWLWYAFFTMILWGLWGSVSKILSSRIDEITNQVYFTVGLLPLMTLMLYSKPADGEGGMFAGTFWALLTGVLGGVGNLAFFRALRAGGKVSVVAPATALFPLITVIFAVVFLRERLRRTQIIGLALALGAIYLLSV